MKRAVIIILDGVGIGAAPDAAAYGDAGSDTLGNVARALRRPRPCRGSSGWGSATSGQLEGVSAAATQPARGAACAPRRRARTAPPATGRSRASTSSARSRHFRTVFRATVHRAIRAQRPVGAVIGNVVGSGTDVIDRYAAEQQRTGAWIVYTSADSVFQIAAARGSRFRSPSSIGRARSRARCWCRRTMCPA